MRQTSTRCLVLLPLLLGSPALAQVTPEVSEPTTDGRSLGLPHHQQQADDAMNTDGGRAGRDEPGAHAPTGKNEPPVLKDGVFNVPGGERLSPSVTPDKTKQRQ
jgi:hypothetical protein